MAYEADYQSSDLGLWRTIDQDNCVLDEIVQSRRNTKAVKRLLQRLSKKTKIGTQTDSY
jgi:transposase-like protein